MRRPKPMHARFTQSGLLCHRSHTPEASMRSPRWCQTQSASLCLCRKPRLASASRRVLQTGEAHPAPAPTPLAYRRVTGFQFLGHRLGATPLRQPKNNSRSKRGPLAAGRGFGDAFKLFPLLVTYNNWCRSRHCPQENPQTPDMSTYLWDITLANRGRALWRAGLKSRSLRRCNIGCTIVPGARRDGALSHQAN